VTDLTAWALSEASVMLLWSAPGDDGSAGTAALYDVRWSTGDLDEATFANAPGRWTGSPLPSGSTEEHRIDGLLAGTRYRFALITEDDAGARSELSNVVTVQTWADDTDLPPAPVVDLTAAPDGENAVWLRWTAPLDSHQGRAASYEIRVGLAPIGHAGFPDLPEVAGAPPPAAAGSPESLRVAPLVRETDYWFAMRSRDSARNVSDLGNVAMARTPDLTPPLRITTLRARGGTSTTIPVSWTAPGDDGINGEAASYDLRVSTEPIDEDRFFEARRVETKPPGPSGTNDDQTVGALDPATQYYFVIVALDESGNRSPLSNLATGTTRP
jgi:chitodextrinase